jgi:transcription-repair coupling factor (superfamily II helicase)
MALPFLLDRFDELPATRALVEQLPAPGTRLAIGGLPGSSPAVLVAALARRLPQRVMVVLAPTPADAERWLADAQTLLGPIAALYPQREGLGAEEPHLEIAGERIETVEALLSGAVRVLMTTARASAERTGVPAALRSKRLDLDVGRVRDEDGGNSLSDVVRRLGEMGYVRVPTVTEVGQFAVHGGIIDAYGFGMAAPARLEWAGDEIVSLRSFD